ncbi:MAG: 16S rRNA (guanine(966)-N(2))-methyltransferase RsmD [Gemmatimonadota bacterium]|nr:MAG: 16S rRNA (guanine(966)-N(2))-methyltransferase RsmD [Gemmatimonadota bacterium]
MRIIAGEFKGRPLEEPNDTRVRPTTEKVREAWFSILGERIVGASVLDLFAGSGALGLEALSRGAERVEFVELLPPSVAALKANVATLGVSDRVRIRRGDALRIAARLPEGAYDVALADPPYTTDHAQRLVEIFRERRFASVLCVEHRVTLALPGDDTRRYGDVALTFCYLP